MKSLKEYHLSETSKIVSSSIPGKKSKLLLDLQKDIESSVVSYPRSMPIAIKRAKGSIIEDVDGNQFIDFFSGCGVLNVGHSNDFVLEYVKKQQSELIHALDFPTENKLLLIQKIINHLPKNIREEFKVSFGGPTGSDAVEAAIKLAKIKTGRDGIIAFTGGYHGMTSGALAVTSDTFFRNNLTSLMPNVHFAPYNYPYRSTSNNKNEIDGIAYFKNILTNGHSGISKPAAILIEPIQGEGGNIVPEDGYLEELVRVAHENDVLVIFDEIQSGFFRTGSFLEFMNTSAIPDIITFSKGFGGIGFPISGLIYKKEVEAWGPAAHIGTFRGNQVSIAAARGAFDFIEANNIEEHTILIGSYLLEKLQELEKENPFIGEVRGRGMMIGVEFVKDKKNKEPFPEFVKKFRPQCFQRGLLFEVGGHYNNVLRLVPPLVTTYNIVDAAIVIMKEAIAVCMEEYLEPTLA
ncbi:diaminobutyrate-2-oxoglutarate transaminase [Aquimarina sp. EL_43]|uniref:aspartate aminotransferase family protein n=1 Tax=unclassified Aquimarina TaxID=2627091 RepID=UPI0018CAD824|nr:MULTISPECIES: aspartate aminotransferase family protein [unclassified Aquimarina]MBG6131457.1 diaminobutyrate-2-oxoglutarate transaminase [Aquimarina sp. EL_35]MBG6151660.1 diaminobutyrate-2-oxoglutarate transaminase [Aquimarina sp. EL_32]MBG6169590.1 diaminobutyrate-2-oxoglutarate transaminase [Aquimarina sp. EL_43]